MKQLLLVLLALAMLFSLATAQTTLNVDHLNDLQAQWQAKWESWRGPAWEAARKATTGFYGQINADPSMELMGIRPDGTPVVYRIDNVNAAITTRTDDIQVGGIAGYDLDGATLAGLYHWDNSAANPNHQEFQGRVIRPDNAPSNESHGNHTAGTMMASGVSGSARGMADNALLFSHDWDFDESEMAAGGASGALVSNHSYSSGWSNGGYSQRTRAYDDVAYSAPNYLIHISSGNYASGNNYNSIRDSNTGKNCMIVGSVNDVMNYTGPGSVSRAWSSSMGPTDDGRIKPDIMGNGVDLYSCTPTSYTTMSGTSMSSPNVAGSSFLLHELYHNTHGDLAWSSTIKATVIHTADECGPADGPDYAYGWGLMNARRAADLISEDGDTAPDRIQELVLADDEVHQYTLNTDGLDPLRVTIAWTDPPGSVGANPALVNDLDIRLTNLATNEAFEPYILNQFNPSQPATTGDNDRDNVEQIYLATPEPGTYALDISHKNSLTNGEQAYSMVVTGANFGEPPLALLYLEPIANFIPWYGGDLEYSVSFAYNGDDSVPGSSYWTNVILPNGNTYGPIFQYDFTLQPGMNASAELSTWVPSYAPPGDYTVVGKVGTYPNQVLVEDSFPMTVFDEWTADGGQRPGPPANLTAGTPWASNGTFRIDGEAVMGDDSSPLQPADFELHAAHPNPFNPTTSIEVSLPEAAELTVTVHNTLGRQVAVLTEGSHAAGRHAFTLDGSRLASGVYLVRASVPGELNATRKVVLMK